MTRTLTKEEWMAEGARRFGPNVRTWRFVCPVCKFVARAGEWYVLGASSSTAFSCIGRELPRRRNAFEEDGPGPCSYAGGGLFRLNPVIVSDAGKLIEVFEFDGATT